MYCLEEFYKAAWYSNAAYSSLPELKFKEIKPIGFTQKEIDSLYEKFSTPQINLMTTARFVMGAMRYNIKGLAVDPSYDLVKTMQLKLDLYKQDGNQEHLMDLINYCKLEIINCQHPLSHFNPVDDGTHAITK